MFQVLDGIYFKLRKEETERAKNSLRRMKVDTILQCLTNNCWKYNIQFEIKIKTKEWFIIKLIGIREKTLLKYHKKDMVNIYDVDKFVSDLDEYEVNKGVYITTGEFNVKVKDSYKRPPFERDLVLEDSLHFIKNQLNMNSKAGDLLITKNITFFKYFPR